MIREEIKTTKYALPTKEKWMDFSHTMRELQTEKRVFQIIEEYSILDEDTLFKVQNTQSGKIKEFSRVDFLEEKDELSRVEYSASVVSVRISENLLDTGDCQEIKQGDKIYKRNIVAVVNRIVEIII